jgi:hypothetical protein
LFLFLTQDIGHSEEGYKPSSESMSRVRLPLAGLR